MESHAARDTVNSGRVLLPLLRVLLRRWKYMAAFAALCVLLAGLLAFCFIPERYAASFTAYVVNSAVPETLNDLSGEELAAAMVVARIYAAILPEQAVLDTAAGRLSGAYSAEEMSGAVMVSVSDELPILTVTVTSRDRGLAVNLAKALRETAPEAMGALVAGSAMIPVSDVSPVRRVAPSRGAYLAFGLLIGLALPVLALFVWWLLFEKVNDWRELEERVSVPVVGVISAEPEEAGKEREETPEDGEQPQTAEKVAEDEGNEQHI